MTRDFAKPTRRRSKGRNRRIQPSRETAPGWVWLLAGIVIGALVTGLVRLANTPEPENAATIADSARQNNPGMDRDRAKPRFDFYTLLKETEVIVPQEADREERTVTVIESDPPELDTSVEESDTSANTDEAPSTGNDAATDSAVETDESEDQVVYVLQAGSFKNAEDADSVRARLLLLNMQASIEKVNPQPGETWHRVLVGPFSNKAALAEARTVLTRNGIDSIQLKRRM